MKKKIVSVTIIVFILTVGIIFARITQIDDSQRICFKDGAMAKIISETAGVESVDKFRVNDLEKIEVLNIGYTSYYETLADIEKCNNLDTLIIGDPHYPGHKYHFGREKEVPETESEERVNQIESEIESILENCPSITEIHMSNEKGDCTLNNIDFLKKGKNLRNIDLCYQTNIDYSSISECSNVRFLTLYCCDVSDLKMINELNQLVHLNIVGTNVSEATDILKLKNLKNLVVTDTPLAENEEQLELIRKQFPEANIYK